MRAPNKRTYVAPQRPPKPKAAKAKQRHGANIRRDLVSHAMRLREAPPLTRQQEIEAIERFAREVGVTRIANTTMDEWMVRVEPSAAYAGSSAPAARAR